MHMHRQELIARVVSAYLGSVTDACSASMNDPQYHAQIEVMRKLLEIFDLAMDQENIPAGIRCRVLERVMMAAPDPTEALKRIKFLQEVKLNPNHWSAWREEG